MNRQFDIPLTRQHHYVIPTDVKGRLTQEDYVFFIFEEPLDLKRYSVVIDTYGGDPRIVSPLSDKVKLPHVQIPSDSFIFLLPDSVSLPKYIGIVERGKRYLVPKNPRNKKGYNILK